MITFTKAYVANGKTYATLEEAQMAEIEALFAEPDPETRKIVDNMFTPRLIAEIIIQRATTVVDILTTTAESRPKARAVNGGKKPRKPKPEIVYNAIAVRPTTRELDESVS